MLVLDLGGKNGLTLPLDKPSPAPQISVPSIGGTAHL